MPFKEVAGIIAQTHFYSTSEMKGDIVSVHDKIRTLFEIGFLGFRTDENIRREFNLILPEAFFFTEGQHIIERISDDSQWEQLEYCVHPIFVEFLGLDTVDNDLILHLDWNRLREISII